MFLLFLLIAALAAARPASRCERALALADFDTPAQNAVFGLPFEIAHGRLRVPSAPPGSVLAGFIDDYEALTGLNVRSLNGTRLTRNKSQSKLFAQAFDMPPNAQGFRSTLLFPAAYARLDESGTQLLSPCDARAVVDRATNTPVDLLTLARRMDFALLAEPLRGPGDAELRPLLLSGDFLVAGKGDPGSPYWHLFEKAATKMIRRLEGRRQQITVVRRDAPAGIDWVENFFRFIPDESDYNWDVLLDYGDEPAPAPGDVRALSDIRDPHFLRATSSSSGPTDTLSPAAGQRRILKQLRALRKRQNPDACDVVDGGNACCLPSATQGSRAGWDLPVDSVVGALEIDALEFEAASLDGVGVAFDVVVGELVAQASILGADWVVEGVVTASDTYPLAIGATELTFNGTAYPYTYVVDGSAIGAADPLAGLDTPGVQGNTQRACLDLGVAMLCPTLLDGCATLALSAAPGSPAPTGDLAHLTARVARRPAGTSVCAHWQAEARVAAIECDEAPEPASVTLSIADRHPASVLDLSNAGCGVLLEANPSVRPAGSLNPMSALLPAASVGGLLTLDVVLREATHGQSERAEATLVTVRASICLDDCPGGACSVGCDGVVNSGVELDACGYCGLGYDTCRGCDGTTQRLDSCLQCGVDALHWPTGVPREGGVEELTSGYVADVGSSALPVTTHTQEIDSAELDEDVYGVELEFARLFVHLVDYEKNIVVRARQGAGILATGSLSLAEARLSFVSGRPVVAHFDPPFAVPTGAWTVEIDFPSFTSGATGAQLFATRAGDGLGGAGAAGVLPGAPAEFDLAEYNALATQRRLHAFPLLGLRSWRCNAESFYGTLSPAQTLDLLCAGDAENCVCDGEIKPSVRKTKYLGVGACEVTFAYQTFWPGSIPEIEIPANSGQNFLCGCGGHVCDGEAPELPPSACAAVPSTFLRAGGEWTAVVPCAPWVAHGGLTWHVSGLLGATQHQATATFGV